MDSEAIRVIQDSQADMAQAINGILEQFGHVALPPEWSVRDVEKHDPVGRRRFRGKFSTDRLDQFTAAVMDRVPERIDVTTLSSEERAMVGSADEDGAAAMPVVFLDAASFTATAVFNLGDAAHPGHGDDTAVLHLGVSPAWRALVAVNGNAMTQRQLVEWLEDWDENATAFINHAGEAIAPGAAMKALRSLTVDKLASITSHTEDIRRELGELERIEVRDIATFPTRVVFRFMPATGLEWQEAVIRLTPSAVDENQQQQPRRPMQIRTRVVGYDALLEAIQDDFHQQLAYRLEGAITPRIGTFALGA